MPEVPASEFWAAAKAAGWFGTIIMGIMWWRAEQRAERERELGEKRHAAVMESLTAIKTFMEVIRDRFPRAA